MQEAILASDFTTAKDIYRRGRNVIVEEDTQEKKSLASLSKEDTFYMSDEIVFNLAMHSLDSLVDIKKDYFDGEAREKYADAMVNDLLKLEQYDIALEAILILNLWMSVVHALELAVVACEDEIPFGAARSIDLAASYWIGADVDPRRDQQGHLLYKLTEEMAVRFDQDSSEISEVNTVILDLLGKAVNHAKHCGENPSRERKLRVIKDILISKITIPLVQALLHNIIKEDPIKIELYTLALVPKISGCSETTLRYLLDHLVLKDYDPSIQKNVIGYVQSMYGCLGITCEDVGEYLDSDLDPKCQTNQNQEIHGYQPVNDVFQVSLIQVSLYCIHTNAQTQYSHIFYKLCCKSVFFN